MNAKASVQRRIRVLSIRSANPLGHGGYIFYGVVIQQDGSTQNNEHFVISVPNRLHITTSVEVGQWWDVTGTPCIYVREHDGLKIPERQIDAEDVRLVLPSGRQIVTLLAQGERFAGIGISKATRLWQHFGERLYELLKEGRVDLISSVQGVSAAVASALISGWKAYGDCSIVQLLHSHGFPRMVAENALSHFEDKFEDALREDPYRLLSFCGSWRSVDSLARNHYRVAEDDERRISGAVEEVLYRLFNEGHTAPPEYLVSQRLHLLLNDGSGSPSLPTETALLQAEQNGRLLRVQGGKQLQQMGAWVMECAVARSIVERIDPAPFDLFLPQLLAHPPLYTNDSEDIELNGEQRDAIQTILHHRIALISGGAGVGKTTLLKALYRHFDAAGISVIQASIAGRAAQRMKEATQRPADTLASLLFSKALQMADEKSIIVIDEASMLDVITMYRLCLALPDGVGLLLVGDSDQLMPVGPGLVFHDLVDDPRIPHARLTQIMRHGNDIAAFAQSIRKGIWPEVSRDENSTLSFLGAHSHSASMTLPDTYANKPTTSDIANEIVRLFMKAPQSTQILCSLRNGVLGVKSLNLACQEAMGAKAQRLRVWSADEESNVYTGFRLGDPVVCTENLWSIGILNGSLGHISEIEERPRKLLDENGITLGFAIAWVEWDDGEKRPITTELLPFLELAYALTVHKAQGSQWPIVIVPITASRLLDRSLLYTAVTRAQHKLLLLGDEPAARMAVSRPPKSKRRHTALRHHLSAEQTLPTTHSSLRPQP
jgi:exodeoxyribonuclease V alpha subunit